MSIWGPMISFLVRCEDCDGRLVVVRRPGKEPTEVFIGEQAKLRQAPEGYPQPWESHGYYEIMMTKPNAESYGLWPAGAAGIEIGCAPRLPNSPTLGWVGHMTKVEEVARAMWAQRRKKAAEDFPDLPPLEEWGDGSIPRSNGIYEEARAAIAAMREPTIEMIINLAGYEESNSEKAEGWRDAIDAALRETP